MIPVTLTRRHLFQWLFFAVLEIWRSLVAFIFRTGSREREVTQQVEEHAEFGNPESVLAVMDQFAKRKRFLMNVGIEKGELLRGSVADSGARRVLELGAYCGYSAVLIGAVLREVGGQLISLEANPENAALAQRVVCHAGLNDIVEIRVCTAAEGIPKLGEGFDLVFIDHLKDEYLSDLRRLEAAGLLNDGAIIVADNVGIFSGTLVEYLDYVRNSTHFSSAYYPLPMEYNAAIEDGVEISVWRAPEVSMSA